MDDKSSGNSKVDTVLQPVTFYPQSPYTGGRVKTVSEQSDVQVKRASHTGLVSRGVSRPMQKMSCRSEQSVGSRKAEVLERQPKSVESGMLTKSKYRLIHKPKSALLPYKRGQLVFRTKSENVSFVRNAPALTLNSELAAEKENKTNSDDSKRNSAVNEKQIMQGVHSRRFFKASFGKRRKFTLNMHGLNTTHAKLKWHKRKTALRNKQHLSVTDDTFKPESCVKAAEICCENNLSLVRNANVDGEILCGDMACESAEAAGESCERNVEDDSYNPTTSNAECVVPNTCSSLADLESACSAVANTSDVKDHSAASVVLSASKSELCQSSVDNTVTSPTMKRGRGLSSYIVRTTKRKADDCIDKVAKKDKEQMLLDFGQKLHETVNCAVCGMTYIRCEPVDELTHSQYHQTVFDTLKFTGWRKTTVAHSFDDGSFVVVVSCDDKRNCRRVAEIKKLVDKELGYIVEGSLSSHFKTYLYISSKCVVGFCLAQHVTRGYRLMSPDECDAENRNSRSCCEDAVPARCGISRIWVLASERRKHVASCLLDVVRGDFLMGYPVAKEELAFSDPTPDGIKFATRYTGTSSFLVYKTAA